jgi:hypothetical protein
MYHLQKVNIAKEAIRAVFSDTEVTPNQTFDSLQELGEEVDALMDAVEGVE